MPFHVVKNMYVVSDTGVKGQCLYTFLIHSQKAPAQIFFSFHTKFLAVQYLHFDLVCFWDYRGIGRYECFSNILNKKQS